MGGLLMNYIKWIVLGYFLCFMINGCDLGISSNNQGFNQVTSSGLGSSAFNPVYVKIVD